jgi:flagellar secretion chaperone FliS
VLYSDLRQYTQRNVMTATPGQLVVMLYDGMIRFLQQGAAALDRGDRGEAGLKMSRAQAIVTELRCTLDMTQGAVAQNLASIYDWVTDEMMTARVEGDAARIRFVTAQMTELRGAWAQIAGTEKPATAAARPVVGVNLAG